MQQLTGGDVGLCFDEVTGGPVAAVASLFPKLSLPSVYRKIVKLILLEAMPTAVEQRWRVGGLKRVEKWWNSISETEKELQLFCVRLSPREFRCTQRRRQCSHANSKFHTMRILYPISSRPIEGYWE